MPCLNYPPKFVRLVAPYELAASQTGVEMNLVIPPGFEFTVRFLYRHFVILKIYYCRTLL